jgi:integrase
MRKIQPTNNNNSIRIRFEFNGNKFNLSALGRWDNRLDLAKAELLAATIEQDIKLGNFDSTLEKYIGKSHQVENVKKIDILELWDKWVDQLQLSEPTRENHYRLLRNKIIKCGNIESNLWFVEITKDLVPSGYNLNLKMLQSCFDWGIKEKLIAVNPYLKLKLKKLPAKVKTKPLTLEQVNLILEGFESRYPYYRDIAEFLFLTGTRTSEAIGLQWKRIDFVLGTVTIADTLATFRHTREKCRKPTKTNSTAILPMSKKLRTLLEKVRENSTNIQPDELVFPRKGKPINRDTYYRAWIRVLESVGVPKVKAYCSRATFASHALEAGLTSSQVGAFLGHADGTMVDRVYGSDLKIIKLPDFDY